MPKVRHLKNAPITEAVIDFRVKLPEDFNISEFSKAKKELGGQYKEPEEIRSRILSIELKEGSIAQAIKDLGNIGFRICSTDGKNIALFKQDGFTFSRLEPYTSWDEVSAEAFRLWNIYVKISSPESITRVAVRYINRIEIPSKDVDLTEYLVAPPTLPSGVPMTISSFIASFVVEDTSSGILANIIQAKDDKGVTNTHIPIILDIDVYKLQNFDLDQLMEIQETFGELREVKNRIFFESITEKTVRMFE